MSYSSFNVQTISYDESGNPTSYKGDTMTWNGRLMTSYTKGNRRYEYSYNSDGMRTVKKIYENNELIYTYLYIWDGDFLLASRISTADSEEPTYVRYLYDESGELYGMDYNGAGFFGFIKNLQGDIVSIVPLDSQSDGEVNIEYDAWGKPIFEQTSSGSEALIMAMIIAATNVAYRSYFYDFDTELYYLRSRYYDPEVGRFINADDTDYLGYDATPVSLNLFAYCENNPVNGIDYDGFYDRKRACDYAKEYTGGVNLPFLIVFNSVYHYYAKGDCANFVSQCLYAGGIRKTKNWWCSYSYGLIKNFQRSDSWSIAEELRRYFCDFYYIWCVSYISFNDWRTKKYIKNSENNIDFILKDVQIGDLLFMDLNFDNKEYYGHATIITKVTNTDIFYSAHTVNRYNQSLKKQIKNGDVEQICILLMKNNAR